MAKGSKPLDQEDPSDEFYRRAIRAGVKQELAELGRRVMITAEKNHWSPRLRALCAWDQMYALALMQPENAECEWEHLLETDGLRRDMEEDAP